MQLTNDDVKDIPRTSWFRNANPIHTGEYEVQLLGDIARCLWNGKHFMVGNPSIFAFSVLAEEVMWRGLARDPYAEGQHRKEQGIVRAIEHAGDDWKDAALNKVREWCASPRAKVVSSGFAFEDIRAWALAHGLPPPPDSHAWGAIARAAIKSGILKFTGKYRPAVSPMTHGHAVKLYRVGNT